MKTKPACIFAVVFLILGPGLFGQEKKPFLGPADVVKVIQESSTAYVISSFAMLKPEETRDLLSLLYPPSCPSIAYPRVEWKDGQASVREFEFKKKASELMNKADSSFAEKNYEKARQIYEQALKADPDCYLAMAFIGDCYLSAGQPEQALAEYERAILKNSNDHRLYFFRGHALKVLGRAEEAWQDWIHALMLSPRYAFVLQVLSSPQNPFTRSIRESIFKPPVMVRKEGANVAVYVDTDKPGGHWLAYANAKAVWLGEPSHRKAMIGTTDPSWSSTEERECLANLMAVYEDEVREKSIEPDPDLEILRRIVEADDLEPFLLYEVYSRLCPWGMLTMPEETQKRVEEYIRKYLVTRRP